jgi:hypothetical protein
MRPVKFFFALLFGAAVLITFLKLVFFAVMAIAFFGALFFAFKAFRFMAMAWQNQQPHYGQQRYFAPHWQQPEDRSPIYPLGGLQTFRPQSRQPMGRTIEVL